MLRFAEISGTPPCRGKKGKGKETIFTSRNVTRLSGTRRNASSVRRNTQKFQSSSQITTYLPLFGAVEHSGVDGSDGALRRVTRGDLSFEVHTAS